MVQVIWTTLATADLREIAEFVARDSEDAAVQLATRIVSTTQRLELFPRSGGVVPERRRDDVREVIVDPYRVIYIIKADAVRILTVQHSARRLRDIPGI